MNIITKDKVIACNASNVASMIDPARARNIKVIGKLLDIFEAKGFEKTIGVDEIYPLNWNGGQINMIVRFEKPSI